MTHEESLEIVEELGVLKFFPAGPKVQAKLAAMLHEWCRGDIRKARWLVEEGIGGMDEYPGPDTLRKLICDKFFPAGALAPYSLDARRTEVLPPIECVPCSDTGTVEFAGRHSWCSCSRADSMQREMPRWIDMLNRSRHVAEGRLREKKRAEGVHEKLEHLMGGFGVDR